jgi:nucleotide-binding universal stress UspA family protein
MTSYHILVPLDLSAYAEHVINYALTFVNALTSRSGTFQTHVTLLHVIETPRLPGVAESVVVDLLRQPEAWAQRTLEETYAVRVREAGVECNSVIVSGVPAQEIIELARASQVNMIMMGTHGHSGIPHMMLGSVADKVLRLAPCPVLVVRPLGREQS